mmetsp:Transcript_10322/g.20295  ORF Transcript_10322/g.20295 Transcript_10322/m.20295 type:complete len:539 (-) Transcript_10322:296-1912(-)|eukprot:CAMPEP_0171538488 /NCGR_PEP_ID=MMETSP0960-20121227/65_1 /TAXON_ID=87120 /ORGANISM="Aurantiochytrium limacinum, Strain ATCCMYA-1381" /LENGTH=538 /DNA_ID=CAMNT_0012085375 /DNA_START=471 /DNA_END=2087 /DNA_ORIENTATION=+
MARRRSSSTASTMLKTEEDVNFYKISQFRDELDKPFGLCGCITKRLGMLSCKMVKLLVWWQNPQIFMCIMIYILMLLYVAANLRHSLTFYPSIASIATEEDARTEWAKPAFVSYGYQIKPLDETADVLPASRLCIAMTAADRRYPFIYASAASILQSVVTSDEEVAFIINDVSQSSKNGHRKSTADLLELTGAQVYRRPGCDHTKLGGKGTCPPTMKAKYDVLQSIKTCLTTTSASYITIVEDDVFASRNFVQRQLLAADVLQASQQPWTCLRLFRTGQYDGFSWSIQSFLELGVISGVLSILWIKALSRNTCMEVGRGNKVVLGEMTGLRFISFALLTMFSLLVMGRQNTLTPFYMNAGIVPAPNEVSSTAVMFPRAIAEAFVSFAESNAKAASTDQVLNQFCEHNNKAPCFLLRPNLVEHTGRFSALSSRRTKREIHQPRKHYASYMRTSEWFIKDDKDIYERALKRFQEEGVAKTMSLMHPTMSDVYRVLRDSYYPSWVPLIFIMVSISLINIVAFAHRPWLGAIMRTVHSFACY